MNIVVDTSAYSALQRGNIAVAEILQKAQYIYVPIIVIGELKAGFAFGSKKSENLRLLDRFLADPSVSVLQLSNKTTDVFSDIYTELRNAGTPIGQNDLWIASLTRENDLKLITCDGDFFNVQGIDCNILDL